MPDPLSKRNDGNSVKRLRPKKKPLNVVTEFIGQRPQTTSTKELGVYTGDRSVTRGEKKYNKKR